MRVDVRAVACLVVLVGGAACGSPEAARQRPEPAATVVPSSPSTVQPGQPVPSPTATRNAGAPALPTTAAEPSDEPPVVHWVRAVPDRIDPLGCPPRDPPERPEVLAKVTDPEDSPARLIVGLQYGVGHGAYSGDVRMRYDPRRKVFRYRLPPVSPKKIGNRAALIMLHVSASNPARPGHRVVPPTLGEIGIVGYCVVLPL